MTIHIMTLSLSYRASRTKASPTSTPAGINELEGSVLLEADDYRRISNDVKSLKTALLKLKRELQADVSKGLFWRYRERFATPQSMYM